MQRPHDFDRRFDIIASAFATDVPFYTYEADAALATSGVHVLAASQVLHYAREALRDCPEADQLVRAGGRGTPWRFVLPQEE